MKNVLKERFQQVIRNSEIPLQFFVTVFRPVCFTVLVASLRDEESLKHLLYAIGFIGFFGILDLVVQSYTRARYLIAGKQVRLRGFFSIALILMFLLSWYGQVDELLVYWLALTFCVNSFLFIREYDLAQKKCIVFTYGAELLLTCVCVPLVYMGSRNDSLIFIAFASYPIGRILGLLIFRFSRFLSSESSSDKVDLSPPSGTMRSSEYMAYCIAQAAFGAIAVSLPVMFYSFVDDYYLYTVALIYMRWFHACGALASTVINVLGARIFYRTINIDLFLKNGHWFADNEKLLKVSIQVNFLLLLGLLIYPGDVTLLVIIVSILILAVMNYFSSLLNAFARPDLALGCHSIVLGLSCHVCAVIFNISCISLVSLGLAAFLFFQIYSRLIAKFRNLTA